MKILFVNPACHDKRISNEDAKVVPIGIYYMAALLLEKGFDARILNLAPLGSDKKSLFMRINWLHHGIAFIIS